MYYIDLPDETGLLRWKLTLGDIFTADTYNNIVCLNKNLSMKLDLVDSDTKERVKIAVKDLDKSDSVNICSGNDTFTIFRLDSLISMGYNNSLKTNVSIGRFLRAVKNISSGYRMSNAVLYWNNSIIDWYALNSILALGSNGHSLILKNTLSITELLEGGSEERVLFRLMNEDKLVKKVIIKIRDYEDLYSGKIIEVNELLEMMRC